MAHPDLNEVLNALLPFAQEMLAKHGEFFPFAAAMSSDGSNALIGADTGSDRPPSREVIDVLVAGLRGQAARGAIRASGVCFDARVVPPSPNEKVDAICARLEYREGDAAEVYLPYRKGWFGRIRYGDFFAVRGQPAVFESGRETGA